MSDISKKYWEFIFDKNINGREYDDKFRDLAILYYSKNKGKSKDVSTLPQKKLEIGNDSISKARELLRENTIEADKDRWTEIALFNRKYWVTSMLQVKNYQDENDRFRMFYATIDRIGMIRDYNELFGDVEPAINKFSEIYKRLVSIQDKMHEEDDKNFFLTKMTGAVSGKIRSLLSGIREKTGGSNTREQSMNREENNGEHGGEHGRNHEL